MKEMDIYIKPKMKRKNLTDRFLGLVAPMLPSVLPGLCILAVAWISTLMVTEQWEKYDRTVYIDEWRGDGPGEPLKPKYELLPYDWHRVLTKSYWIFANGPSDHPAVRLERGFFWSTFCFSVLIFTAFYHLARRLPQIRVVKDNDIPQYTDD